jgi:DNA-binding response OmpR family regulator
VTDRGIGIPVEQIENVFKRYYQVQSGSQTTGTGIGLAYVKELVGFMNGNVSVISKINEGTTVSVSIPLNESEIIDKNEFKTEIPKTDTRNSGKEFDIEKYITDNHNENSVLIVEDNDDLRTFISDLLKDDFNLFLAKDGKEGIQSAFGNIPDIIVSDVMMPNTDGFQLCEILKNDERTSHIPIILLTAKDSSQSSLEGYQTGADDYIIKPFDNEILRLKIKNILATRESVRKQFNLELPKLVNANAYTEIDKNFLKKCIQIIEQNINNPEFSVGKLSSELGFSRSNLYRKIQSLTDFNPAELVRNIRMQNAAKLLKSTNLRVYEVATEVGYDNTNKFSQAFKKQFGILPSVMQEDS